MTILIIDATCLLVIGLLLMKSANQGRRLTTTENDFKAAGWTAGGVTIGLSVYATFVSTNLFLGQAGMSYDKGVVWSLKAIVMVLMCVLLWTTIGPRFVSACNRRSTTLPEYFGKRYDSLWFRFVSSCLVVVGSMIYLTAVFTGATSVLLAMYPVMPIWFSIIIIAITASIYTAVGGMHAVLLTDKWQAIVILIGGVCLFEGVVARGGGIHSTYAAIRHTDVTLSQWDGTIESALQLAITDFPWGLAIAGGITLLCSPRILSRLNSMDNDRRQMRLAFLVSTVCIAITYGLLLQIGSFSRAITDEQFKTSQDVIIHLVGPMQVMGVVLSRVFCWVLLIAMVSSLDSVLITVAATIETDLLPRSRNPLATTRVCVFASAVVALLFSLVRPDIVGLGALCGSIYAGGLLVPLFWGLYRQDGSPTAVLASSLLGGGTAVIVWALRSEHVAVIPRGIPYLHEVFVASAVAIVAMWSVNRCVGKKPQESATKNPAVSVEKRPRSVATSVD